MRVENGKQTQKGKLTSIAELEFDSITDPNDLYALREEWQALYDKAHNPYFTQSFEWNWCCWQTVSEVIGEKLYCLVIRHQKRAVLILPLAISKKYRIWSVARCLATVSTEYSDVLVDAAWDCEALIELALQQIMKNRVCDAIQLTDTRSDSALYAVAKRTKTMMIASVTAAPYISLQKYADWDSYYQQLSKNVRHSLSRRVKRLSALGHLHFEMLSGEDSYQQALDWLIQTKLAWVATKQLTWSPFNVHYINCIKTIIRQNSSHGKLQLCVLKLDDQFISAQLMRVDKTRVEFVINAYDPDYSAHSPTKIIIEHCMQWAFEQHFFMVDYRLGDDDYKRDWATELCDIVSYDIYCCFFGKLYFLTKNAHNTARTIKATMKQAFAKFFATSQNEQL